MAETEVRSALVVVDAQVGVCDCIWDSARVVGNIENLVNEARRSETQVFWIQHSDQELEYGSDAWKLADNFEPETPDIIIHKRFNSSFADTDLDLHLKKLGIRRIVLAGASTNWCIRATAYSAMDLGYDLVVVSDGHSTESLELNPGWILPAEDIIEEFNTVMRWIGAPNVRIDVLRSCEVTF